MRAPEPWQQRAARLQWQAQQSEANRQVKLENRSDAHERRVAARAKRARRNKRRRYERDCMMFGLVTEKWIMGARA